MGFRLPLRKTGMLAVAAVLLMPGGSSAHWYDLGPSKDEWGVKYDGEVEATEEGKLKVHFTLSGQGRLKPIHSVYVMALGNPDGTGSRTYVLKTPVAMQPTTDGALTGQVEVSKEFANRAVIRIFTMTVDGRSQMVGPTAGARYYDIPLKKFLKTAPAAGSPRSPASVASPRASRVAQ